MNATHIHSADLGRMLDRADLYRLNLSSLRALLAIKRDGADSLTMTSTARALDLSTAAVTGIADNLEALGFIARRPARVDRRVIWLEITPRGLDALEDILNA